MSASAPDSRRPVGGFALLALGINGIVGVGIFFVPADVARAAPGPAGVLVFAVTALALAPVALAFAALGRRFDEDGGPVVFARAAFGELSSFVVGWIAYVSAIASLSAVTAGLTSALLAPAGREGPLATRVAASALITVLAGVCATGLRLSARTWTTLTVLKLIPLLALAAAFLLSGRPVLPARPVAAEAQWAAGALLVTFAYQGFEIVPVLAGQARASARTVPAATVLSLVIAAFLYVALQAACIAALPDLARSASPLADAAAVYGGPALADLVQVGTSVSALGIAFGMTVTTPHYLAALARGEPRGLGLEQLDARGVPRRALLVTWVLVLALLQAGSRAQLFALSATAVLMQYVVSAAALAVLAARGERGLSRRHLALALPAMVVGLAIVSGATAREGVVAAGAVALGLVLRRLARP